VPLACYKLNGWAGSGDDSLDMRWCRLAGQGAEERGVEINGLMNSRILGNSVTLLKTRCGVGFPSIVLPCGFSLSP